MSEPINPTTSQTPIDEGKTTAIIAYLTVIGLIVALVLNMEKKNPFAAYHIRQSLGLMLTGLAISFIAWIPLLGWLVGLVGWILLLIMWIAGLINALNGREKPVPVLGNKYLEWFKTI